MSDYDAGRAVGFAEGYIEGQAAAPVLISAVTCTCGVMSGGVRDARKDCPMHARSDAGLPADGEERK